CGGTIALKRRQGADVTVAFMTDGAASDPGAAPDELSHRRKDEAFAACRALGVPADRVLWFGFPDGRLSGDAEVAAARVASVLKQACPAQVFIPFGVEEHPDHTATGRIVATVVNRYPERAAPAVFEYPIWFWRHWPWVPVGGPEAFHLLGASRRASFGGKLRREFTRRVDVASALDQKRAALDEHRTQMTKTQANTGSLADVSGGEFLKCFFEGHEWFRVLPPGRIP
ncbi:MAG TPA: PIG-L deacetylase family protein, partial [Planctomycetota bacterium]|nr:PIG-L deacetylase family protein [Planctomycetota bacterium]